MTITAPATAPAPKRKHTRKPKPPPAAGDPMTAGEWRAAILTADVPRNVKVVACQLAHWSLTPAAHEVITPNLRLLGEASELPDRVILNALCVLRDRGWIGERVDEDGERFTTFTRGRTA